MGIAESMGSTAANHLVPDLAGRVLEVGRSGVVDFLHGVAMHLHHEEERLLVRLVALERTDRGRELRARAVRRAMQEGGDRSA